MRARRARLVVLTALMATAWTLVPVRLAWSAPQVRLSELAAAAGQAVRMPFALSHLGVTWSGSEDAGVEVRTALLPGAWGPWQPASVAHDLGNPAQGTVFSGLLRADGARYAEAR
ncbi:MAG: hypothetical protein M3N68_09940, partial [Actinomycetota bacterium]|nr:hypothetical protein [Actinomycetota bacterium]